jgi:hypothetical protein
VAFTHINRKSCKFVLLRVGIHRENLIVAMVKVIAPSDLNEGYTFDATVDGELVRMYIVKLGMKFASFLFTDEERFNLVAMFLARSHIAFFI